jgi:hypothetical protein
MSRCFSHELIREPSPTIHAHQRLSSAAAALSSCQHSPSGIRFASKVDSPPSGRGEAMAGCGVSLKAKGGVSPR